MYWSAFLSVVRIIIFGYRLVFFVFLLVFNEHHARGTRELERKPPLPGLSCARVFSISLFLFRSEKKSLLRRLTITLSSSKPLSILGEILHLKLTASPKLNSTNHKLIRKFYLSSVSLWPTHYPTSWSRQDRWWKEGFGGFKSMAS